METAISVTSNVQSFLWWPQKILKFVDSSKIQKSFEDLEMKEFFSYKSIHGSLKAWGHNEPPFLTLDVVTPF